MIPDPERVANALAGIGIEVLSAPSLAANGWESHVFRCESAGGTLAVRILTGTDSNRAQREADIMRSVGAAGYPVPRVHAVTTVAARPTVVMDFVDGPTLEQSGWAGQDVARLCVDLLERLHTIPVSSEVDPVGWLLHGARHAATRFPQFVPYIDALSARQPPSMRHAYCHLDFHPGNVLWDGSPWVIDWTSGRITDPGFDYAWTRLLAAMYEPEWLDWLPEADQWFETAMALRRLVDVAGMLTSDDHAAGDELADGVDRLSVPAEWLERGTGIPVSTVDELVRG
ncbi:MAG: aminoglycoside phosphotransferase family protein [Acidimicrobiia bacterium]|nr:aminoglycoside phosphotransferase family protein [Acidimicrobiia bacterium]